MLPWEQPGIPEAVRAKMRSVAQERATFLAPPVRGSSSYRFELSSNLPLVMEALSIDKRLEEQRHLLVPEQVSEELFFQNYFHHLHVIAEGGVVSLEHRPADSVSVSSPSPVLVANSDKASSEGTEVLTAVTPLEEFECISEKISQECLASEVSTRLVSSQRSKDAAAATAASLSVPVSVGDAASSWEAEIRAELESM